MRTSRTSMSFVINSLRVTLLFERVTIGSCVRFVCRKIKFFFFTRRSVSSRQWLLHVDSQKHASSPEVLGNLRLCLPSPLLRDRACRINVFVFGTHTCAFNFSLPHGARAPRMSSQWEKCVRLEYTRRECRPGESLTPSRLHFPSSGELLAVTALVTAPASTRI